MFDFSPLTVTIASLAIVAVLYTLSVFGYIFSGRPGMALAFLGYVIGNIGFIMDAIQQSAK